MINFNLTLILRALLLLYGLIASIHLYAQTKSDTVLQLMDKVAHWQINEWAEGRIKKLPKTEWENGVLYTGLVALKELHNAAEYDRFLFRIGEEYQWNTGKNRLFADDYCVAQMYTSMYLEHREAKMIAKWRVQADSIVNHHFSESLEVVPNINHREWAWCDALFMGPPGLALLSRATGDLKYLNKADTLWWKTSNYLYSNRDSLYYRDSRFFNRTEANGRKIFWSRGNGWVLAALARMIDNMPSNYKDKKRYIAQFKQMAKRIAELQQPEGGWHASLYDPEAFNLKESSGTGLFCYGLAWGIRKGLLPKKQFGPIVAKAWHSLVTSVHPDGKIGYIQNVGDHPAEAGFDSTNVYGVGAFLLAGSEVYKLLIIDHE